MRVFVIGASGYIGGAIARELGWAGHEILGLARSQEAAQRMEHRGIEVLRGDLEDPEGVAALAREAEATVYAASADTPTAVSAAEAIAGALEGSGRAFVIITGAMIYGDTGQEIVSEESPLNPPPGLSGLVEAEEAVLGAKEKGVRSASIRAALVYGGGGGAIPGLLMDDARRVGHARHIGDGENRWATVHVHDLGRLFVLAVESAPAGTAFNAVSENPTMRQVAGAVGEAVGFEHGSQRSITPEKARQEWGFFADPLAMDLGLSGKRAEEVLGWSPRAPSIYEDL